MAAIEDLSDEILLHIIGYLTDITDRMNLSIISKRFQNILNDFTLVRKTVVPWSVGVDRLTLLRYLGHPDRAAQVTSFTIVDLYWIPSGLIRNIALKLRNMRAFRVAGTTLSWKHLVQVLDDSKSVITEISWTWDNELEKKTGKELEDGRRDILAEFSQLKPKLEALKILVLDIPVAVGNTDSTSYLGVTKLVSLCPNLERLWILSWPCIRDESWPLRTAVVQREEVLEAGTINLASLHSFVIKTLPPLQIYAPRLIMSIVNCFGAVYSRVPTKPYQLQFYQPYLEQLLSLGAARLHLNFPAQWPTMDLSTVESYSLCLCDYIWTSVRNSSLPMCKNLSINGGVVPMSEVIALDRFLDSAPALETFCLKAVKYTLNWQRFAINHPALKAVNVCEDNSLAYPDFCIGLALLRNLKKLAIPGYTLFEIRDKEVINHFRATCASADSQEAISNANETAKASGASTSETLFNKGRRIGVPSSASSIADSSRSISGLDLLTADACPKLEELELGFELLASSYRWTSTAIIVNSLTTISRWKNLKKLTLDGIPIVTGSFLIDIAQACKLTSLRLSNLGSRAHFVYKAELCSALRLCPELRNFRFQQSYIGSSDLVFNALMTCKKLERLVIISDPNYGDLKSRPIMQLMHNCSGLTVLYLYIASTSFASCRAIKKEVESTFKSKRPALSVCIQNVQPFEDHLDYKEKEKSIFNYPSIHYRQMVAFAPQVCNYMGFPDFN